MHYNLCSVKVVEMNNQKMFAILTVPTDLVVPQKSLEAMSRWSCCLDTCQRHMSTWCQYSNGKSLVSSKTHNISTSGMLSNTPGDREYMPKFERSLKDSYKVLAVLMIKQMQLFCRAEHAMMCAYACTCTFVSRTEVVCMGWTTVCITKIPVQYFSTFCCKGLQRSC